MLATIQIVEKYLEKGHIKGLKRDTKKTLQGRRSGRLFVLGIR